MSRSLNLLNFNLRIARDDALMGAIHEQIKIFLGVLSGSIEIGYSRSPVHSYGK